MDHQDWTPVVLNAGKEQSKKKKTNQKIISQLTTSEDTKIETPKNLGQLICQARTAKSKTQKQLSAELGISTSILSRWETNKEAPTNAQIANISSKLGVILPRSKKIKQTELT
jgi:ribosome-binding protein aMBF1 (putative translation factor)